MISQKDYIDMLDQLRKMKTVNDNQRKLQQFSIERLLRKYSEERPPMCYSQAAIELAQSLGITLNIKHHGHIHHIRKQGVMITLDHANTINDLFKRVMNPNEKIVDILNDNITIAITTDEDLKLNALKCRKNRTGGYQSCYKEAGILL
jgi:hypothetical protein